MFPGTGNTAALDLHASDYNPTLRMCASSEKSRTKAWLHPSILLPLRLHLQNGVGDKDYLDVHRA